MQSNPFDMSNMGLNQENPLFTSMNMMRQMWEGMANNPMGMSTSATAVPSPEDLEKRIADLRAVENWLRLNLSMLTSTIQGLEIQRSTLSTLQAFTKDSMAAMPGLAEAMSQATMQGMGQMPAAEEKKSDPAKAKAAPDTDDTAATDGLMQAGQAWWGLMQQQLDALAQATTESMQQTESTSSTVAPSVPNPSADTTFGKKAVAKKTASTTESAAKSPKSVATKKTVTKATAKKATKTTKAPNAAKGSKPPSK